MKNSKVQSFFQFTAAICLISLCLGLPFAAVYARDQRRFSHTQQVSGSPQPPTSTPAETEPPVTEPAQLSTEEKLMLLTNFRKDPEVGVTVFPSYVDTLSTKQFNDVYDRITQEIGKLSQAGLLPDLELTWDRIQYYSPELQYVRYTKGDRQLNTWAMTVYGQYTMLLVIDADTYTIYELLFYYSDPESVPQEYCILPGEGGEYKAFLEKYLTTPLSFYSVDQKLDTPQNFNFDFKLKLQPEQAKPSESEFDYTLFLTPYSMVLALEVRPIYSQVSAW